MKELQRQASPSIVIALAGNKADLASKRMVEYEVSVGTRLHHELPLSGPGPPSVLLQEMCGGFGRRTLTRLLTPLPGGAGLRR